MFIWLTPFPILLTEDPDLPEEVLVAGDPPAADAEGVAATPAAPLPPAPVPEDAFPTAAALDAIHAELAGPPPAPDLALREEVAALLGLAPAAAADAEGVAATLAAPLPPAPEPAPAPAPAAPVPEDAFPTAAALDAIHAELAGPPPAPDLALREEVAALLGLAPAAAADAEGFAATLAALPPPAPEPDPVPGISPASLPALDWTAMSRDWGDPSRGWILG